MSGGDRVENLVVITHGLTMRLILMHLGGWSPNTFHTVWNANNCDTYVLEKDLTLIGMTPYAFNRQISNTLRSSLMLHVSFVDNGPSTVVFIRELLARISSDKDSDRRKTRR